LANRIINKEIEQVAIDLLKHHPRNANHGDVDAIKKSLAVNGWYGSVVANTSTKHILAGNHRVMAAKALGWETVPVQWVDVTPEEELRILVVDNRTTRIGQDDTTKITDILAELANTPIGLDGTGYSAGDLDALIDGLTGELEPEQDSNYSRSIQAPTYEPTGECPEVSKLYDTDKQSSLIEAINQADLPDDIKAFLIAATGRHIVFDYRNIAEYYAHADEQIQKLFEDSALVIIDFDSALQNGFVKMVKQLQSIIGNEKPDEDEE
jgi:hypothetical protein